MNRMDSEPAIYVMDNRPKIIRYGLAVGAVCFGFWFFDYVMRGWFGGVPNLAVSLRHTFIIAICLVFVVGFLLKDQFPKIVLSSDGLELQESGGRIVKIGWNEITAASIESNRIVCSSAAGQTAALSLRLTDPSGFVNTVELYAGSDHVFTAAVKKALKS